MDARSGTIVERAVVDNADSALTPGLFARIGLVSKNAAPAALVPAHPLGTDLGKRYVLVLCPGDNVEYGSVALGWAVGEYRIVLKRLRALRLTTST